MTLTPTMTTPKATPLASPVSPTSGLTSPPTTNWRKPSSAEPVPAHRPVRSSASAGALPIDNPRQATCATKSAATATSSGIREAPATGSRSHMRQTAAKTTSTTSTEMSPPLTWRT